MFTVHCKNLEPPTELYILYENKIVYNTQTVSNVRKCHANDCDNLKLSAMETKFCTSVCHL
jgi:hypothetical protein